MNKLTASHSVKEMVETNKSMERLILNSPQKSSKQPMPRYKLPSLGQKHRQLLLRIDEKSNSDQTKERNAAIKDCMDQIMMLPRTETSKGV